jgi:hypothetical protein
VQETGGCFWVFVLPVPKELDDGMVVELFEFSNLWCFTDEVPDLMDEFLVLLCVTWGVLENVVISFLHRLIMEENGEEDTLVFGEQLLWDHKRTIFHFLSPEILGLSLEEFTTFLDSSVSLPSLLVVGPEVSDVGPDYGVSKKSSEYKLKELSVNSHVAVEHLVFGDGFFVDLRS